MESRRADVPVGGAPQLRNDLAVAATTEARLDEARKDVAELKAYVHDLEGRIVGLQNELSDVRDARDAAQARPPPRLPPCSPCVGCPTVFLASRVLQTRDGCTICDGGGIPAEGAHT